MTLWRTTFEAEFQMPCLPEEDSLFSSAAVSGAALKEQKQEAAKAAARRQEEVTEGYSAMFDAAESVLNYFHSK